jgi:hypothetical protein
MHSVCYINNSTCFVVFGFKRLRINRTISVMPSPRTSVIVYDFTSHCSYLTSLYSVFSIRTILFNVICTVYAIYLFVIDFKDKVFAFLWGQLTPPKLNRKQTDLIKGPFYKTTHKSDVYIYNVICKQCNL